MPKKLIIAAVCARPFVQAAVRAGHEVVSLDAFADEETRRMARQCYRISYERGHFDTAQWLKALRELRDFEADGLVYGSGFEATPPMLLETAGAQIPVIGNKTEVMLRLKTPQHFFGMLDALKIAYPQVRYDTPPSLPGWLMKAGGGSGGTHIRQASANTAETAPGVYYQREIAGEAVSLLFAAAAGEIRIIGFNSQWTAPAPGRPYRYGGVASQVSLPPEIREQLVFAARAIAVETGLRGLNSLDAIVSADTVHVLEINPRLSATFELYCGADGGLFDLHLQACSGNLSFIPQLAQRARAQRVVYAPRQWRVPDGMDWPEWAADRPSAGDRIAADDPLCSVSAEAGSMEQARAMALERERTVLASLLR